MTSPFDADFDAADALFAEAFGVEVSIIRRGFETRGVTAEVVVRDQTVDLNADISATALNSRDYVIARDDYRIDGRVCEPEKNDIIRETINGQTYDFTILPIGDRPAYEWANVNGSRWLLHTTK